MWSKARFLTALLALGIAVGCQDDDDDPVPVPEPTQFTATPFARNLTLPIGLSMDSRGQAWVTESGTGRNDARVSLITADGTVYPALTGFTSVVANGSVEGIGHLLYRDGTLYVLDGGAGRLYTADVSGFKAGDPPRTASSLTSEDIGTFVRAQQLSNPINTNLYNMTFGPDGNLYIVDSGANAIIKRVSTTKAVSVFARFPNISTTTEPVPTGIVYDGQKFLVSSLTGFPFTSGAARIFQVDMAGTVSEFKTGFTTLTDITLTANNNPVVIEYAQFSLTPPSPGFAPRTGRIANGEGTALLTPLDRPTDIERFDDRTYYVLCNGDGTLQKLTY